MTARDFVARLSHAKSAGDRSWQARCPAHDDKSPSLSITEMDDGSIRVKCFAGCTTQSICSAVGLAVKDLFPEKSTNGRPEKPVLVASYQYKDEFGNVAYEKLRYAPKDFRIRRPDPSKKGGWLWGLGGTRKILYRLPELLKAIQEERPVYFVEGEKDVDTLFKAGFAATCNPCGSKEKWEDGYTNTLSGSDLIIIPDKDENGRALADTVAKAVEAAVIRIRTYEMPDRNGKKVKDVTDWFSAGGQAAELDEIVNSPPAENPTEQIWSIKSLSVYDTAKDDNAVIGVHDGKTTRYLCKGAGSWLIGQSGLGKSSLIIQQAFTWALGLPCFGIFPVRPMRVLIVQNENDQGDCAEATQGVVSQLAKTDLEMDAIDSRVRVVRCRGKTGKEFCLWLGDKVIQYQADLVYVDPLLRFAGIDVSRQDQCTKFLNEMLDPMLAATSVVLIGAHHTGKPKTAKETSGWTIYDMAYSGIGSSELVNWARAITILRVLSEENGTFELLLSKRGPRAWATHPNGDFTTSIFLKHAASGIYWDQLNPEDLPSSSNQSQTDRNAGGRPSKIQGLASLNIHDFLTRCRTEGEGLREIVDRFETYLAAIHRIDVSHTTCRRGIQALVGNGKLTKTPAGTYIKGPNA